MTVQPAKWRKSSKSGTDGDCVEVASTLNAVRDSKNPGGGVLITPHLGLFLEAAKGGQLVKA